jgi:hypothetical protein
MADLQGKPPARGQWQPSLRCMLHPLPFTTFGEIAALGLKATVYCSACYEHRPIDPTAEHLRDRYFATTRFRCTKVRLLAPSAAALGRPRSSHPCCCRSAVKTRWLSCSAACLPSWEIKYVPIDRPPWSVVNHKGNDRFKCPGCGKAVPWRIPGPAWRPTYSRPSAPDRANVGE